MPKLLLVNPNSQNRVGLANTRDKPYPPINLALIAALTPPEWDVKILDENFQTVKIEKADLVAITAFTATVTRAYEIAQLFRQHRIPVILGGVHVTFMPEEAMQYADAIVQGEAESVWRQVLDDFQNKNLKQRYIGKQLDLKGLPYPRRDLLPREYNIDSIQTSRGCPMNCDFCSVPVFNGKNYRVRPVEEILEEMQTLIHKIMIFIDDNLYGYTPVHAQRAVKLFKGMIARGIRKEWVGSVSANLAGDEEFLYYARKSGCRQLVLGIETDDIEALKLMNKQANVRLGPEYYERLFKQINRFGISASSTFIYGTDADTLDTLEKRTQYLEKTRINAIVGIVYYTPFPGTKLFNRLQKENRLLYQDFPADWQKYDLTEIVYQTKNIMVNDLKTIVQQAYKRIFSWQVIWRRFFYTWRSTGSLITTIWAFLTNLRFRQFGIDLFAAKKTKKDHSCPN